ncbi:MAG: hypothetical protein JO360_11610 [Acidobacteria bacterium]|nr:hypothetical protein [Acidobacteriota bacterium]
MAETTASTTPLKAVDAAQTVPASTEQANLTGEQAAYRDGFQEGFLAAQNGTNNDAIYSTAQNRSSNVVPVQYRSSRNRVARNGSSRQVYYDYNQRQPQKRSFWQKHRDKLTVAAGTGGGALLGGLIGGKKGALIGALAGAGGSALYTYKIRKKDRRY